MELDALQAHILNMGNLICKILHASVNRTEAHKAGFQLNLLLGKLVDGMYMLRLHRHRKNQIPGNTHRSAALQQRGHRAVHIVPQVVIIPDILGGSFRNRIRIYMGVHINEFHLFRL